MSLLTITHDDVQGRGRPLPDKTYRATIEEAAAEDYSKTNGNGESYVAGRRLRLQFGNMRTTQGTTEFEMADGSVFRIGNRKVFDRLWFEHESEQTQRIGLSSIKRLAISAGLAAKPGKGESTELNFDSFEELAQALVGREVVVRTKQETRTDKKTKKAVLDADGNPTIDVRVGDYVTA